MAVTAVVVPIYKLNAAAMLAAVCVTDPPIAHWPGVANTAVLNVTAAGFTPPATLAPVDIADGLELVTRYALPNVPDDIKLIVTDDPDTDEFNWFCVKAGVKRAAMFTAVFDDANPAANVPPTVMVIGNPFNGGPVIVTTVPETFD